MTVRRRRQELSPQQCAEVAQFLLNQIVERGSYTQREFVDDVRERFGEHFIYINENKNLAVNGRVYTAFRKMHNRRIRWDPSGFLWFVDYYGPDSGNEL